MWRTALIILLAVLAFYLIFPKGGGDPQPKDLTFNEFLTAVEGGKIKSVEITGMQITGKMQDDASFITHKEYGYNVTDVLIKNKVPFKNVYKEDTNAFWGPIFQILIWVVLMAVAFVFLLRLWNKRQDGAMGFGRSKADVYDPKKDVNKITFADVAGIDEVREEVEEIVDYLRGNETYAELGGRIPRGVLLMGPSGVGKTYLAKAIAGEAGVPFLSISGSEFVEMFVGVGASRVRHLFEEARKRAPCIIFIDEIDAMGRQRGTGMGGGNDEREQTLNQILVEMDGFDSDVGIILIAATNRPDILDAALLRPGRFDRKIVVPKPDVAGRQAILVVHTRKKKLDESVDLNAVAKRTSRMTGADLENICNEAALSAGRAKRKAITTADFDDAIEKITMGKKMNRKVAEKEHINTAYHEAGHAVANLYYKNCCSVLHKVSIVPRGNGALGVTSGLLEDDILSLNIAQIKDIVIVLLAGRAAEETFFGRDGITTGASNDLKRATDLLRKTVAEWGMDEKFGLGVFDDAGANPFLGRELAMHSGVSQGMQERIEERVRELLNMYYNEIFSLVSGEKYADVEKLAKALLEKETLSAEEVRKVLEE